MNNSKPAVSQEELLARIRANAAASVRTDWIARLIGVYGSAAELLKKTAHEISQEGGISEDTARRFLDDARKTDPELELEKTLRLGARLIVPEDGEFPRLLKNISDPPLALYVAGELFRDRIAVGVVGTRRPTAYGRRMAALLSRGLANMGVVVASGLARGIDTTAHDAAMNAAGKTYAVLGTGLAVCYPPENRKLFDRIAGGGGAIISELPVDAGPLKIHFPRRNRIISGLSLAVVVVEGAETSGALITARAALEQGREVLAVPGPVDSETSVGPNKLIKDGASLVENARDIVLSLPSSAMFGVKIAPAEIAGPAASKQKSARAGAGSISEDAAEMLKCLGAEELGVDEIVERLGWDVPRIAGALFELETLEMAVAGNGSRYSRKAE